MAASPPTPQFAYDMRAIIHFDDYLALIPPAANNGLHVHTAPGINTPKLKLGATTAGDFEPLWGNGEFVPWESTVEVAAQLALGETLWYQIIAYTPDGGTRRELPESAWIGVEVPDGAGSTYKYWDSIDYAVPPASPTSPCEIAEKSGDITFYYDRTAAAHYGIVQSFLNNNAANGIPAGQVTLDTFQYADGANWSGYPYFPFLYDPNQITHTTTGATGSAVFISEDLWLGGMPMTEGVPGCADADGSTSGWQYCLGTNFGTATISWRLHSAILGYFVEGVAIPDTGLNFDIYYADFSSLTGLRVPNQDPLTWCNDINGCIVTQRDGTQITIPYLPDHQQFLIDQGCTSEGGFFNARSNTVFISDGTHVLSDRTLSRGFNSTELNAIIQDLSGGGTGSGIDTVALDAFMIRTGMADGLSNELQAGDIIWVNTFRLNPATCSNDGTDNHSFEVVGFGPIFQPSSGLSSCELALNYFEQASQDFVNNPQDDLQIPTGGTATYPLEETYVIDSTTTDRTVPYVVDFPGAYGSRTQRPIPRPFYCTRADDNGINSNGRFASPHSWFFFRMPDLVTIPVEQLYSPQ